MSNLETKFEALELQLATQQTEVVNALNAILEALGAPPPTATVTLATVVVSLATLNTNIVAMKTANTTFYTALLESVGLINTNTDTIISNNSLNAQRVIAAIYATACACATDLPLLPPAIDVTPTEIVDDAKCKRIQFYLSLFSTWLFDVANYGSSGAAVTGDVLFSLLSAAGAAAGMTATGAEVGSAAGIPGAVVGAIVGLIVGAVYLVGGAQLLNYANDFASPIVQAELLAGLYAANNADEGQHAFQVAVGDHFDPIPAGIINALWWSAWSNDLYSGSPVVDDSAFDGSICAPPPVISECWQAQPADIVSIPITNQANSAHATYSSVVLWPSLYSRSDNYHGTIGTGTLDIHADNGELFVLTQDLFGYYVILGAGAMYYDDEAMLFNSPGTHQITVHTTYVFVIGADTTFQLCPTDPSL